MQITSCSLVVSPASSLVMVETRRDICALILQPTKSFSPKVSSLIKPNFLPKASQSHTALAELQQHQMNLWFVYQFLTPAPTALNPNQQFQILPHSLLLPYPSKTCILITLLPVAAMILCLNQVQMFPYLIHIPNTLKPQNLQPPLIPLLIHQPHNTSLLHLPHLNYLPPELSPYHK
jgi:hypothetical protein